MALTPVPNRDKLHVAIVGGRDFNDYDLMKERVNGHLESGASMYWATNTIHIVSGGARGADSLAVRLAKEMGWTYTEYLPDWDRYGKSAGYKRNRTIVEHSNLVIAFWDGKSKGTEHTINIARDLRVPVKVVSYNG